MTHVSVRVAVAFGVCVSLLLVEAPTANAKGASKAVITGPGLSSPIVLDGAGNLVEFANLAALLETSGFFLMSCETCDGRLAHRPAGSLGDRYAVTWTIRAEGPMRLFSWDIDEFVYPFAQPRPVVRWVGGQRSGMGKTVAGWALARPGLTRVFRRIVHQTAAVPPARAIYTGNDGIPGTMFLTILAAIVAVFGLARRLWWRRSHAAL
jgi:hypothetical protein